MGEERKLEAAIRVGPHLWVGCLRQDAAHSVVVTGQAVHLDLGPHIPHPAHAVPPAGHQDVQGRVQLQCIDAAQMPVVVADDLQQWKRFEIEQL